MRRRHYLWTFKLNSTSTFLKTAYRFHLTPDQFMGLCDNIYSRFDKNPPIKNYGLLQRDPHNLAAGIAYQFSFDRFLHPTGMIDPSDFEVPLIKPVSQLRAIENTLGGLALKGKTLDHEEMVGQTLCEIEVNPAQGISQHYFFYSLSPGSQLTNPIQIPRLNDQYAIEAKKLEKEKGGRYKESDELIVDNKAVTQRMEIKKRIPDQNEVMGYPAVKAYFLCANEFGKYLHPQLSHMLLHCSSIMHLSTLESKEKRNKMVSKTVKNIAYRDRMFRPEWLHRLSFGLHPIEKNPQYPGNLGAARGCDNTQMMLLEYAIRWFALNVPTSQSRVSGRFDMLLDSNVIDRITLSTQLSVNGMQCKITQKIDALRLYPEQISASDLAGFIAILNMLTDNVKPESQQAINIEQPLMRP